MNSKRVWATVVVGVLAAGLATAPTATADDDLCAGADPATRDIGVDPLVWESSRSGGTVYNVFTPVTQESGTVWHGIHSYAGVCGLIQEITDCLADGHPLDECIPE